MSLPSLEVVADRIETICVRLDEGLARIEKLFETHSEDLEKHKDWDLQAHTTLRDDLAKMRTDIEVFKARWSMLAVVASAVVSGIISLVLKFAL